MNRHTTARITTQRACFGLAALVALGATAAGQDAERYLRAKQGASVRNFADEQGLVVRTLDADEVLHVVSEAKGTETWYEVEVAGGMPVWVYGQYLQPTEVKGVLRVTGDGVRMRPRPSSEVSSYPLDTRLDRGDKVEMIDRNDAAKAFGEDWIKVWSPSRARAWVLASETTPIANAAAGAKEWTASIRKLPTASAKPIPTVAQAQGDGATVRTEGNKKIPGEAFRSLAYADTLFEQARKKVAPTVEDYAKPQKAYTVVTELAPKGTTPHEAAKRRLDEIELRVGVITLADEIAREEDGRKQRIADLERAQKAQELEKTAHWGRFTGRGWLEQKTVEGDERYYLRWGGDVVGEVLCSSGRYDLAMFLGNEIGVSGTTLRAARPAAEGTGAQQRLLDATRVEVISAGARRR